ncbi:hypothetical protein M8J77_016192 [Diaphorina citri]|nr:hypothetical protein M8J77_016192 [Diaphorina citri]
MISYHTTNLVLLMLVITLRQTNCEDIKSLTTSTSRLLTKTISCSEHEGNGTHACHPDMGVTPNTLVTRTLNLNAEGKVTSGVEKERLVIVDVPKRDDENTPKDGNHSEKLKNRKEKIVDNIPEDVDRKNKQNTPFEEFSDTTKPLADLDHEIVLDKRSSNVEKGTLTEEVLNGKIAKSEKTNEVIPDSIAEESGVTPSVDNPTVTVLTVNTDEPITEGAVEPTVGVTEANGGASGVGANGVGANGGVAVPTLAVNEDDTKLTHKTTSIPRNPITRVAVQDCPCDITKGVCDINCCCDNDCSVRDRLVFSHCLPLPILSSSQYCFSKQLIYIKNSPHYIVTQPDNSLLCIETENLRSKTNFTHFRPITTLKNFAKVFDRRKRPTWSQAVLRTSSPYSLDRLPHNQSYKVGQPIWILNATSVGVFELPHHTILSDECSAPQAIFYLEEWSSECRTQVTECTPASILSAPRYYKHFLVLASTSFENLTSVQVRTFLELYFTVI